MRYHDKRISLQRSLEECACSESACLWFHQMLHAPDRIAWDTIRRMARNRLVRDDSNLNYRVLSVTFLSS
ncbi:hypothetical protein TNCV_2605831 [Trichonephila clavipes]|nr:hypothetical protein TNCV_2605831 [Trichonephila clavipes]